MSGSCAVSKMRRNHRRRASESQVAVFVSFSLFPVWSPPQLPPRPWGLGRRACRAAAHVWDPLREMVRGRPCYTRAVPFAQLKAGGDAADNRSQSAQENFRTCDRLLTHLTSKPVFENKTFSKECETAPRGNQATSLLRVGHPPHWPRQTNKRTPGVCAAGAASPRCGKILNSCCTESAFRSSTARTPFEFEGFSTGVAATTYFCSCC